MTDAKAVKKPDAKKPDNFIDISKEQFHEWDDRIDAIQHMSRVHSKLLKDEASDDYVMAYLEDDPKTKDFIVAMEDNAYATRMLISRYKLGIPLNDPDREAKEKRIDELAYNTSQYLKIIPSTLLLLNRNKQKNFIVKLMGGMPQEDEEQEMRPKDTENFLSKLFKKKPVPHEDEE